MAHMSVREIDEVRASILAEVIREDLLEDLLAKAEVKSRSQS